MAKVSDIGGIGHGLQWGFIFLIGLFVLPRLIQTLSATQISNRANSLGLAAEYDPEAQLQYQIAQATARAGGF